MRRHLLTPWALLFAGCLHQAVPLGPSRLLATPLVRAEAPCPKLPAHGALEPFGRRYFSEPVYEAARAMTWWECRRFTYAVGEAEVSGWLVAPRADGAAKHPVIYFARGGTGDFGAIDDLSLVEFSLWAKEGYAVLATDYRFVGPRARRDEWGGAEVDDVLRLADVAAQEDTLDTSRAYLIGQSRGAVVASLALARGLPVRAAALIGGPSDLAALAAQRPEFVHGDEAYDGWAKVWPDWEHRKEQLLRERSAVAWPERLTVPLLLLHARSDRFVPVSHALELARRIQALGAEYELIVYGEDGHSLPGHRADRNRHLIEWFRAHEPARPPSVRRPLDFSRPG